MSELQRAFDAHLHIIDPNHPLIDNHGFLPEPFTVADYRARLRSLPPTGVEVVGGAVVSGSFRASIRDTSSRLCDSSVPTMSVSPSCPMRPPMTRSCASPRRA